MSKRLKNKFQIALIVSLIFFVLTGCVALNKKSDAPKSSSKTHANEPYFPTSFGDFEVPGELRMEMDKTLFIKTSSFNGGIVNLTGYVEAGSLTDFFVNSMQKNGWRINGEIRSGNVLLAFTKPNKNCMITIQPGEYGTRTQVNVYITEDAQGLN
nr:hypothetical protein [Desulfobulbaceae bacterium]